MNLQIISIFFWQGLLLTSSLFAIAIPVLGEGIPNTNASSKQLLPQQTITKSIAPIREIPNLNQIEHTLTSTQKLVQSPTLTAQTEIIPVTGVKLNSTDKGLEVILETTADSNKLQVTPKTDGNSYIVDIPNAQLRLTSGNTFRQSKPASGITEVTVTNVDTNSIRLTVTGEAGVPTVQLFDSPNEGLVFGVSATATTAQQPTQTTPKPAEEEQKPIELEVIGTPDTGYRVPRTSVGTKTDTPLRDISQSIQVLPRQLIEDQSAKNAGEVLRNAGVVSSVSPNRVQESYSAIRGFSGFGQGGLQNFLLRNETSCINQK